MVSNCCEFYIDNKMRVGYIFTIIIVYLGTIMLPENRILAYR